MKKNDTEIIITVGDSNPIKTSAKALEKLAKGLEKRHKGRRNAGHQPIFGILTDPPKGGSGVPKKDDPYIDLGWMNGWSEFPVRYQLCQALNHRRREIQYSDSGSHNEVICDVCKIKYHYDSSG